MCAKFGYIPNLMELSFFQCCCISSDLPYNLTSNDVYLTIGYSQAIQVCMIVLNTKGSNILLPQLGFLVYETACGYNGIEI